jgi:hypothetical protein
VDKRLRCYAGVHEWQYCADGRGAEWKRCRWCRRLGDVRFAPRYPLIRCLNPEDCVHEEEAQLLQSVIGEEIEAVKYDRAGRDESTYLQFGASVVKLSAVDVGAPALWRIAASVHDDIPQELEAVFDRLGAVEAIDVYAKPGVEMAIAFRLAGPRTLWAYCAGGDYVATELGDYDAHALTGVPPSPELPAGLIQPHWERSRRL